jgi:hypothetical protein
MKDIFYIFIGFLILGSFATYFDKQFLDYECYEQNNYGAVRTHGFYSGGGKVIASRQDNYNDSGEPYLFHAKMECSLYEGERFITYSCLEPASETDYVNYKIDKWDMTVDIGSYVSLCRTLGFYEKYTSSTFEDWVEWKSVPETN